MKIDHFSTIKKEVEINEIYPNPWNPNEESEFVYEKLKENIKNYGFNDPVLVTLRERKAGTYVIIDGEHRWKAAKELGYTKLPIEIMIDESGKPMDDFDIQFLTIQMNKGGEDNTVKRGKILKSLREHTPTALNNLSLFPDQIEHEIDAIDFDMDYSSRKPTLETTVGISFKVEAADVEYIEEVLESINEDKNKAFEEMIKTHGNLNGIKRNGKAHN